jgi:UDP-glucose 4-epimerase
MSGMVLVAGASGPLGRAVAAELRRSGHTVTGISRSGSAGTEQLDVTDSASTAEALERLHPAAVLYLARPDLDEPGGKGAMHSAVESLRRFAEQCAESGANRFIFASSAAVYGTNRTRPLHEHDPVAPDSPYAELKSRSELALEDLRLTTALSVLTLRIFNIYGPGFSSSLVNRLVLGDDPVIYDTDRYVRDYIHASDVARGFRFAVEDDGDDSTVLNLGTGSGTSNRSLLALCANAAYRTHPNSDISSFSVADMSRIHGRWKFEPHITLADAVLYPDNFR